MVGSAATPVSRDGGRVTMGLNETGRDAGDIATRDSVQLGGCYPISYQVSRDLQVLLLQRRFGFSTPTAVALAVLAFGEVRQ